MNQLGLSTSAAQYLTSTCSDFITISPTSVPTTFTRNNAQSANQKIECFSGFDQVALQNGDKKFIYELKLGDHVPVVSKQDLSNIFYSEIIALPHKQNSNKDIFIELISSSGKHLTLTKNHLILSMSSSSTCLTSSSSSFFSSNITTSISSVIDTSYKNTTYATNSLTCFTLKKAKNIQKHDYIYTTHGIENVVSMREVTSYGKYTFITLFGDYVLVNDIIASPYAENHIIASTFYQIYRNIYKLLPPYIRLQSHSYIMSIFEEFGSIL